MLKQLNEAVAYISARYAKSLEVGLILGSGLGSLADEIENPVVIPYKDIPHFPESTVEGHAGQLVLGMLEGKSVLAMQGRFHYYEGYEASLITFPVRVMKALGASVMVVTNACGGLNDQLYPGALMFIEDHINFFFDNPLIGPNQAELGPRFPDMSHAYTPELIELGQRVGERLGIETKKGVYTAISGPNYLGKAELRVLIKMGSDVVGMSTIPEVIVANHAGMKVLGISCVTDMAIPDQLEPLEHEMVMAVANRTKPKFINLVKGILKEVVIS